MLQVLVLVLKLEHLLALELTESVKLAHLVALDANDTLDFRVAAASDIVAHKEFVDKLIVPVETQAHLIREVHRRIEELLVRELHRCIDGLDLDGCR